MNRLKEIDLLRALAIILMVAYHLAYDLKEYAGVNTNYEGPFWHRVGTLSALLFIFLSGLCSGFSKNPLRRGFQIFGYGMGITLVTYVFIRATYIRFGILHFLGIAMILTPLLKLIPSRLLALLSLLSALIGFQAKKIFVPVGYLLPLGLRSREFGSIDYYPLFPYLSVTILGILFYKYFFLEGQKPLFNKLQSLRFTGPYFRIVEGLSKNSLAVYLIHQPIVLAGIFMFQYYRLSGKTLFQLNTAPILWAVWLLVLLLTFGIMGYRLVGKRLRD